ncbi:MAG: DUF1566 domain-containing protein, partial [Candidatus Gastranaerophilales bacterium]|nr:DUF1566 domain-containing protein [Candidatus Gastranaerophilales bacterium]
DTTTDKTYDSSTCGEMPNNPYCAENRWAGAKKACADLGWHLPSDAELTSIYITTTKNSGIKSLLNMSTILSYWSSSEYNAYNAWFRRFSYGYHNGTSKDNTCNVRCVK